MIAVLAVALRPVSGVLSGRRVPLPALPVFAAPDRVIVWPVENATGDATLNAAAAGLGEPLRQYLAASAAARTPVKLGLV